MPKGRLVTAVVAIAVGVIFLHAPAISSAQSLSPGEIRIGTRSYQPQHLRSETPLVELEVVVRDDRGRPVPGLTKDDFTVLDSGKQREITSFNAEVAHVPVAGPVQSANTPGVASKNETPSALKQPEATAPTNGRWVAVLFDDVNTKEGDLMHAKIASTRFVKEALASGDHIAVFTASGTANLGFTSDASAVLAKIQTIGGHSRISPNDSAQCPRISPYEAYHIVNNDPVVMQVKVAEGCSCETTDPCGGTGGDPTDLVHPSVSPDSSEDPMIAGSLSSVIIEVRASAQAIWGQSRLISQDSLDEIKGALDYLTKAPGKRVLLLATDGFFSWTLEEQEQTIIDEAVHDGVVVNSIDAKGLYTEAPGPPVGELTQVTNRSAQDILFQIQSLGDQLNNEDAILAQFAESTGGLLFRNNNDLEFGFHELGVVPEYSYTLGFPPEEDGKYHKIKIELKNGKHYLIQARPGYFAPRGSTVQPTPEDRVDAAMMAAKDETTFPVGLSEQLNPGSNGERLLITHIHIDISKIPFQKQEDRRVQKLTMILGIFDAKGNFIVGKEADMELALKPATFERLSKEGIGGTVQFGIPPGTYRLRVVVQEGLHGSLSSVTRNVRVE
jgi:VWFA-related protein